MRHFATGRIRMAAALLFLPAAAAVAQTDCRNPQTQTDMNRCANADYAKADAELNRVYQQLRAKTGSAAQLEAAERAWLAYRDKECDLETAGEAGGSIQPLLQATCLKALTERRNAELRRLLKCQDDAATCAY